MTNQQNVVFVFSSQGGQWPGMGRRFFREKAIFRELIKTDQQVQRCLGWSLLPDFSAESINPRVYADEERIQPAVTAIQIALSALLRSQGIQPLAVAGLSMGELAAAYTAEVFDLEEAMRIACCEARLTRQKLPPGCMAYVDLTADSTNRVLREFGSRAYVAVELSPRLNVISGPESVIREILPVLKSRQVHCGLLRINFAFHSPEVMSLQEPFLSSLKRVRTANLERVPIYSSVTGHRQAGTEFDHQYWWQIVHQPARFHSLTNALLEDGYGVFVEIGPHPTLLQAIDDTACSTGRQPLTICGMKRGEDERATWEELLRTLRALDAGAASRAHS